MLIPRYLSNVTYEIEELFAFIENDILSDIARRIGDNKLLMTSTAGHQLNRLNALDVQYKEVQKKLAKYLNISESRVSDIISESSYRSVDDDNKIFKKAHEKGFIPEFDFRKSNLKDTILKGISFTNGELRNICKSMASASNKIYGDALDMAYLSVKSGAFSQADAVKNAVKQVAKRGITWIEYDSGAHRRPDSAVRNAVRTGVNQTACRCQDKNFNDMGGNLVEVSSHMGARPEHAVWQGKIYWRKTQYKNYTNFELATGYGSGDGLGGWGCRHGFFPFFEGLSSKAFEHFGLNENKEVYILEQTQRYNERMIREWKRRTEVCKAGGIDYSFEQSKIKEWQGRQKELLDAHPDMKRNYAREDSYTNNSTYTPQQDKMDRKKNYDMKSFEDLRRVLGARNMPNSFAEFQNIKYNNPKEYKMLLSKKTLYNNAGKNGILPNSLIASTTQSKLQGYLLNSNHQYGKDKAHVINSVLGYNYNNWDILSDKIFAEAQKCPANNIRNTKFGIKYDVPMIITGEKGRSLKLNTVWQIDKGSNIPRFITATFDKKKKR